MKRRTRFVAVAAAAAMAALTAGCASSPGAGAPSAARIRDACLQVEMPAALEKYKDEGAKAEGSARTYAGLICGFVANECSKTPGTPQCQRDLKRYGLLP